MGDCEPLLAPRLNNAQGFKDIVFLGGTDTLYAVDSELGVLLWKKTYDEPAALRCSALPQHQYGDGTSDCD